MLPPAVVNIDIDINVFLNITVFWKNFKVLSLTCWLFLSLINIMYKMSRSSFTVLYRLNFCTHVYSFVSGNPPPPPQRGQHLSRSGVSKITC